MYNLTVDESNLSTTLDITNMLIGRLDLFINFVGVISTISLGFIAFLAWKHNELRKQAENEVEKAKKLGNEISILNTSFNELLEKQREQALKIDELFNTADRDVEEIKELAQSISTSDEEITKIKNKLNEKIQIVEKTLSSLATTSRYTPGDVPTETSKDSGFDVLRSFLWPDKDKK